MIRIDGSIGEGGGQMVRTSIALSCLTETPVEIINIRAKRENSGLRAQHLTAIKCMEKIFNAETKGLEIGSKNIIFIPKEPKEGTFDFNIGTAGSMTLVFQTIILGVLNTNKKYKITITGGSDVRWAPPWNYFEKVFIPCISNMGINVETKLEKRGYYPKGGGLGEIIIQPVNKIYGLKLDSEIYSPNIQGILHISNLPDDINKRIKHAAIKTLFKENLEANIRTQKNDTDSTGVGLTIWNNQNEKRYLGSAVIGEKGLPSEILGSKCGIMMLKEIQSNSTVDTHLFDQILPFIYYAKSLKNNSIVKTMKITSHAETNIWILKKFFYDEQKIYKKPNCYQVEI